MSESMLLRVPKFDADIDASLAVVVGSCAPRELEAELSSWEGTPHRAGQQRKGPGGGVDCTHFVAAVLDWAYERAGCASSLVDFGPLPRSAQDLGIHRDCVELSDDPMSGAAWWFARRYPLRVVSIEIAQPLDLAVMTVAGGANHLGVIGKGGDLWHASGGAGGVVTRASLADAAMRRRVRLVFRPCLRASA